MSVLEPQWGRESTARDEAVNAVNHEVHGHGDSRVRTGNVGRKIEFRGGRVGSMLESTCELESAILRSSHESRGVTTGQISEQSTIVHRLRRDPERVLIGRPARR